MGAILRPYINGHHQKRLRPFKIPRQAIHSPEENLTVERVSAINTLPERDLDYHYTH